MVSLEPLEWMWAWGSEAWETPWILDLPGGVPKREDWRSREGSTSPHAVHWVPDFPSADHIRPLGGKESIACPVAPTPLDRHLLQDPQDCSTNSKTTPHLPSLYVTGDRGFRCAVGLPRVIRTFAWVPASL